MNSRQRFRSKRGLHRNNQEDHQIITNFIYGRKQQQQQQQQYRTHNTNANYGQNNNNNQLSHYPSTAHTTHVQHINNTCETIVLEINEYKQVTETVLRKHFASYGAIKKIWFNCERSKAFVSFYDRLSVNMVIESGQNTVINGHTVCVSPLMVVIPEQLQRNPIAKKPNDVKSVNLSLSANFPVCEEDCGLMVGSESAVESNVDSSINSFDLVQTVQIDNRELLDKVLKAKDIGEQIEIFCAYVSINETDEQNRYKLRNLLQELLCENGFLCEFHFLGSTVNKLGFRDSDIDFYIELKTPNTSTKHRYDFNTAMSYLEKMQRILKRKLNMFVPKPIASIRCPIVRLDFKFKSDDLKHNGIVCDLSLSNRLGPQNSKLIRFFCDIEPRFRQLSLILRYWAKKNEFIGSQEFSSYAFTMLCVFFAQNSSPPLLPTVDDLMNATNQSNIIDGWECGFSDQISAITGWNKCEPNTQSLPELIESFFNFYSHFDFTTQVICPKNGRSMHKSMFVRQNVFNFDDTADTEQTLVFNMTPFCCIQDPFDLRHNITAQCRHNVFYKFCEFIHYISNNSEKIFRKKQPELLTQNTNTNCRAFWGIAQLITEFDRNETCGYVYPHNMIGYPSLDLIMNDTAETGNNSLSNIMKMMANGMSELVLSMLSDVYRVECDLLAKWDIVMNELSPFAEYIVKFRGLDFEVINLLTRQSTQNEFSETELQMSYFEREKLITERIVERNTETKYDIVPIRCHFILVLNARFTSPSVELEIVEVKPSLEYGAGIIDFIKKVLITAANERNLLSVNKDLLLTKIVKEITL